MAPYSHKLPCSQHSCDPTPTCLDSPHCRPSMQALQSRLSGSGQCGPCRPEINYTVLVQQYSFHGLDVQLREHAVDTCNLILGQKQSAQCSSSTSSFQVSVIQRLSGSGR